MNAFTSYQSFLKLVILENDVGGSSWNNKSNFSWMTERVDLLSVTEYVCIIDCFLAICLKVLALIQYGDIVCTDFLLMKMLCYFNNQKQRTQLFFFILYSLGFMSSCFQISDLHLNGSLILDILSSSPFRQLTCMVPSL